MGNCTFTGATFKCNEEIPGQDHVCAKVFKELMLSTNDINKFYTAFKDIDADNSYYIREDELFAYFRIEQTVLNKRIFRLYGESGYLDFLQFVCSMWNFLSTDPADLAKFAFFSFCDRTTMCLTADQFAAMMATIHGASYASNKALDRVANGKLLELRGSHSTLSLKDFTSFCRAHRMLIDPVVMLQLSLRITLIGDGFWKQLAVRRYDNPTFGSHSDVMTVSKEAVLSTQRLLARKRNPGAPARRSSVAVLMAQMKKVVPTGVLHGNQQPEPHNEQLPMKARRRRSLLKPKLNGRESKVDDTLSIVTMLSDPKAHKKQNNYAADPMITVTDENTGSNSYSTTIANSPPEAWRTAEKGGGGSNNSTPRGRGSNAGSPRSKGGSPRGGSPRGGSPRGGSPRGNNPASSPRSDNHRSPAGSPRGRVASTWG